MPFKILVTGGREFRDIDLLKLSLSALRDILGTDVILGHGACKGLDLLAEAWAKANGWDTKPYPANWTLYKNAAGPIRNSFMLDDFNPDLVLSYPGNGGTKDMSDKAFKAHKTIWYVNRL